MTPQLAALLAAAALTILVCAFLLWRGRGEEERMAARIASIKPKGVARSRRKGAAQAAGGGKARLKAVAAQIGGALTRTGAIDVKTQAQLEVTLTAAGYRGEDAVRIFIGAKLLLLVCAPALMLLLVAGGTMATFTKVLLVAGSAIGGLLLPDQVLGVIRRRHAAGVARGLPDAVDLMVICTEAGLGFESGLDRVAAEIAPSNADVAREFALVASEMRILPDRRQALMNLGDRTGVVAARRVAATLAQSLQYGTPLAQAFKVLAAEMRQERLTEFEARAAKLPVILTLPMVVFILPCVFLVVAGPAILQLLDTVGN
ncbi:type II secretion system F family protein [Marinimicrococcus flavescens]|uniref:Type II secretion system F family protein n=1 Tax=Marinimicrococcus flavescens TaxID=3031815 RepID=A0AAP3UZ85_9PROT|nr:type II secretion system F family protein [Marinimicrococcus flavescens]